ncbi:YebC-like protein [Meira miltonrushii]|uniref:YebC-like protein n=1 Tax=Meira miltonrushii TaxID=1280837 RepID=A0A316V3Y9_9BASI|nr:YebC-like protein [Meira miltonrushii]PWN32172.1 YebC-like protein [Meira miltonrushii]
MLVIKQLIGQLPVAGPSRCNPASQIRHFSNGIILLSGHNKWSKIKHKKLANDTTKSTGYSNLSREIIAAVRNHPQKSASPEHNARLGQILRKAKSMEVPKDKIEATLKKAESIGAGGGGQTVTYEALGPVSSDGIPVALIVECSTDSPPRTHARVKEAFNKNDIRLSSTTHMFTRTGVIRLSAAKGATFDSVFETAVENGAEDVREWELDEEDSQGGIGVEITCEPTNLQSLTATLSSAPYGHTILESEPMMIFNDAPVRIRGIHEEEGSAEDAASSGWLQEDTLVKMDKMLGMLEENADCSRVWSNIEGWPSR